MFKSVSRRNISSAVSYSCRKYIQKILIVIRSKRGYCDKADDGCQSRGGNGWKEFVPSGVESRSLAEKSRGGTDVRTPSLETEQPKAPVKTLVKESMVDTISHVEFISDTELYQRWKQEQSNRAYRPKTIDPKLTSLLLFPGQGSQFVGMGKNLLAYPGVRDMYEKASEILGYDLLSLCLYGPKEKLDRTVHCQPAVVVTSLAAADKLKEDSPEAVSLCVGAAGFSVGEITALMFAGAMSFEDGMRVVKVRAEAMQKASEEASSGMMTVFCFPDTQLKQAMLAARAYCQSRLHISDPVCTVANYLFTSCKVVAGHSEALEFLQKYGKEFGIRRSKMLPVSGAFHTKLMESAKMPLIEVLKCVELKTPSVPVHSNVDGMRYGSRKAMMSKLGKQVHEAVRWEQILHILYSRGPDLEFPNTYEVGPGNHLGKFLKMTNNKAYLQYKSVSVGDNELDPTV